MIDVETWHVTIPCTTGTPPSPRFGCSLAVHNNVLWVIGGGYGYDLARSGYDHDDIFCLDLKAWEWRQAVVQTPPGFNPLSLGRCHASVKVRHWGSEWGVLRGRAHDGRP